MLTCSQHYAIIINVDNMSTPGGVKMFKWLVKKRESKGITQAQLAIICGVDVTMISHIENGKRRPSVEVAKKIAEALNFDWTLFYEQPNQNVS